MPDICQANIFELLGVNGLFWFCGKADSKKYTQEDIAEKLRSMGIVSGLSEKRRGRKISAIINANDYGIPDFDHKLETYRTTYHESIEKFFELFFAPAKELSKTELSNHFKALIENVTVETPDSNVLHPRPWTFPGWEDPKNDENYDYESYENYKSYVMKMLEAALPRWHKSWAKVLPLQSEDERQASGADGLLSNAPQTDSPAYSPAEDGSAYSLRFDKYDYPVGYFIGREELLDKMRDHLNKDGLVILSGIGGIGKSRLAQKFANLNYSRKKLVSAEKASSFEDIILNLPFTGLMGEPENREDRYEKRLELLRRLDERTALIIDNADEELEDTENFLNLRKDMEFHLIITSRFSERLFPESFILEVDPLSKEKRKELFFHHSGIDPEERSDWSVLDDIIGRIDGHTMLLELIAKSMDDPDSDITLEQMRDRLGMKFDYEGLKYEEYGKTKFLKEVLQKVLFRPQLDAKRKGLLYHLAFLPTEGLPLELLERLFPPGAKKTLRSLENGRWVEREGKQIRIHPVIREAVREDIPPEWLEWGFHREFMEKIREAMKAKEEKQDKEKRREENQKSLCLLAWNLCEALHEKNKVPLNLWDCLSEIAGHCKDAYQHEAALRLYGFLSEIEENNVSEANKRIELHLDFGSLYQQMADYEEAIRHYQKALRMAQRDDDWRASCYKSLGVVHRKKGDYKQAEGFFIDALKRYTRKDLIVLAPDGSGVVAAPDNPGVVATQDDRDVITAQDDLGVVYRHLGEEAELAADSKKSLDYYQKAKAIAEAVLALREKLGVDKVGEKALATSHHRVGSACYFLGKYEEELYKEALKEHEEALKQRQDRGKATSYNWIGKDLLRLGRLDEAKTKLEESLDIRKDSLGEHHPDVAKSLMSLGEYYERIGDLEEAINNTKEAHEICKERLGCEHLYTKQAERRREKLEAKQRLKKQVPVPPGQEKRQ